MFDKSDDIEIMNNLDLFKNISVSDIPNIDMPYIKIRDLNPIVCDRRLK